MGGHPVKLKREGNVDEELLKVLVCPKCKGDLCIVYASQPNTGGRTLDCEVCKLSYPIRDGIPVMLINEAIKL